MTTRRAITRAVAAAAAVLTLAPAAMAHAGATPPTPGDWWSRWGADPGTLIGLALSAWLYTRGLSRLWETRIGAGVKAWEAACFAAGWLSLILALVSPLHPLGAALFAAHMTQHEVLMLVSAPLMVLGRPVPVIFKALPPGLAGDLARWGKSRWWTGLLRVFSGAMAAWLLHAVILWTWHIPALFEATLRSDLVHALQHASFFGSAVLFWWAAMHGGRAVGYGAAVLYMFTTAVHSGALGALITFAPRVWYRPYEATAPAWGLTPLEDQSLGGLIMWVPAGLVYIVAGLALLAGWLRESERRARRWQTTMVTG